MANIPSRRNQSLECCRLFAAAFIVLVHVPFPGAVEEIANCLVRFTIPFFFMISGYFCFGARKNTLKKRFGHIVMLNIYAIIIHVLWNCAAAACRGESVLPALRRLIPTAKGLSGWVFMHNSPYSGHLWYLTAIAVCYAVLWVYTSFFGDEKVNYQPLYTVSVMLFAIRFAAADLLRSIGFDIPYYLFRDAWFIGLPMISLGLFLRQYRERIASAFNPTTPRLLLLLIAGVLLSLLQWRGFGTGELPVGGVVQAVALFLLSLNHPSLFGSSVAAEKIIGTFGFLSTWVYVLHLCVCEAYDLLIHAQVAALFGSGSAWLRPVLVLLLTVTVSYLLYFAQHAAARLLPAKRQ